MPHERFHDDILDQRMDGSVGMNNQLYDLDVGGANNGYAEPTFDKSNNDVTLETNGKAQYNTQKSKNKSTAKPEVNSSHAFANPLYDQMKSDDFKTASDYDELEPLPEDKELTLHHNFSVSHA